MINVVLVIHLIIAIALVGVILLQRSEGGALGIGGGGGGLVTGRAAGNLLTRATAILATVFFITSMVLAILSGTRSDGTSIFDQEQPIEGPATPAAPAAPEQPQAPSAPLAQ